MWLSWQGPFVSLMTALRVSLFARFQRIFMTRGKKVRCRLKFRSLCLCRRQKISFSDRIGVTVQAMKAELDEQNKSKVQNVLAEVKVIKAFEHQKHFLHGKCGIQISLPQAVAISLSRLVNKPPEPPVPLLLLLPLSQTWRSDPASYAAKKTPKALTSCPRPWTSQMNPQRRAPSLN